MHYFFEAIVPILATKFEYFNVILSIDMDKPVAFTSSQYMQSWVSFIKLTLATVAVSYLTTPLQQIILLLLRL